jgi:predicted RNase H-related nuclease YkuK (DUF458 family)
MKVFKQFGGKVISDIKAYVKDYVVAHPEVEVYVGSDSSQLRKQTVYATVILFYHPGKGAHIIYNRERIDKVKVLYERLWKEVEASLEVAELVDSALSEVRTAEPGKRLVAAVDLDFNPSELHKSNVVHDAAVGTVKGYGFVARSKPNAFTASYAADLLCK